MSESEHSEVEATMRPYVEAMIEEQYPEYVDKVLYMDGHDYALMGYMEKDGHPVTVYSFVRILETLIIDGMDADEALDHFGYNIQSAYVGEFTPVIVYDDRW